MASIVLALPSTTPHLRLNTGMAPAVKGCSRIFSRNRKRTVRASTTSQRSMPSNAVCTFGAAPLLVSIWKLCTTSSGSTGSPLLKRASGRSLKLTLLKSGATQMASASRPYMVDGSSCARWARPSTIQYTTPPGELPRVVQGLNLSKLVRRSGFFRRNVPPLGASGFTYSKCVKSGPYLGGP